MLNALACLVQKGCMQHAPASQLCKAMSASIKPPAKPADCTEILSESQEASEVEVYAYIGSWFSLANNYNSLNSTLDRTTWSLFPDASKSGS